MAAATKTETPKDVDEKTEVVEEKDFLRLFTLYSKIGNSVGEGKMSLQGAKLWLETAKILDEKKGVAESDVEETFSAEDVAGMNKEEFQAWIQTLAEKKNKDKNEFMNKLVNSGPPAAGNKSDLISSDSGKKIKP
ncbi:uncharacterized protein CDAR_432741 [Caerostris darwini]|uniref:Uncharacterized protein n=1 Tax=Caerostris darwini TaxID=1538125 RepID=A0AAV4QI94_9ARAC|nr:uncharacterized protein CDAR_432741 [Caerostris darwini]